MGLARKVVRGCRQSAIRPLPQRRLRIVKSYVLIRNVVLDLYTGRPGVVVVKLPRGDLAVVFDASLYIDHTCRAKVGPVKLFLTRPNNLHRFLRSDRQARRFNRTLARVFATIAGTSVRHDHAYSIRGDAKRFGEFSTYAE